ncbi:hypothetical protein D3C76_1340830 [compost metagenome]
MGEVDKRNRLDEEPFSYNVSKAFGNSVIKNKILSHLKKDVRITRILLIPTALSGTYPPDK